MFGLVLAVLSSNIFMSEQVAAGTWYGTGYFSNKSVSGGADVLSPRTAIPSNINTKSEFINLIKNKYNNGNAANRTGAAFIINLMVRAGAKGEMSKARTPSAAMIDEWEDRINHSSISLNSVHADPNNYGNGRISFYSSGANDDFFSTYNSGSRDLILFRDSTQSNRVVFVIERPCANPVGGLPGLEDKGHDIVPSTAMSVDGTTRTGTSDDPYEIARPLSGSVSVTWRHSFRNNGQSKSPTIPWKVNNSNTHSGTQGELAIGASGPTQNDGIGTNTDEPPYRVRTDITSSTPIGTKICQRISVQRYEKGSGSNWRSSASDCVIVTSPGWRFQSRTNMYVTNDGVNYTSIYGDDEDPTPVYQGQAVLWRHSLVVRGGTKPNNTPIDWHYKSNYGSWNTDATTFGTTGVGPVINGSENVWSGALANNTIRPNNANGYWQDYRAINQPIGTVLCEWVRARPWSQQDNGWTPSDSYTRRCVQVQSSWSIDPTLQMQVWRSGVLKDTYEIDGPLNVFSTEYNETNPVEIQPGDEIRYVRILKNNGPRTLTETVYGSGLADPTSTRFQLNNGSGVGATATGTQIIDAATVASVAGGGPACEYLVISKTSYGSSSGFIGPICFAVPYDYVLEPNITVEPDDYAVPDSSVDVTPSVNNTGNTRSAQVHWEAHMLVYRNEREQTTYPGTDEVCTVDYDPETGVEQPPVCTTVQGTSPDAACDYYKSTNRESCDKIGEGDRRFDIGTTALAAITQALGSLEYGDRVCFSMSVRPWRESPDGGDGANWRHSELVCISIAKLPKLQAHGGDVRVAGHNDVPACGDPGATGYINTSFTTINNRNYGSWGEFGAFSRCPNEGFTSGAQLALAPSGDLTTSLPGWHSLTFANTPAYGMYGNRAEVQGSQSLASCPSTVTPVASFSSFKAAANETNLSGTHCIVSAGTVVIDEDVILDNDPSSSTDIGQLIIIANDIKVRESVERVDAWLIASRDLYTCVKNDDDRYAELTVDVCEDQLVVNGPAMVGRSLYADRTHGGESGEERESAEVFNLPASSVLWRYQSGNDHIDTVSIKELPARY